MLDIDDVEKEVQALKEEKEKYPLPLDREAGL
jgi:hypothetical protein